MLVFRLCCSVAQVTVSGQLGGFYLFATRFTIYITFMNLLQVHQYKST